MWLGARKGGEGRESFAWDDGSRWEYTGAWLGGVHLEHHHHLVLHHHHHHPEHHHSTGGEGGPGLACLHHLLPLQEIDTRAGKIVEGVIISNISMVGCNHVF